MRNRILPNLFAGITMAMLTAWSLSARAQVIVVTSSPDEACAFSFDENFNQINIGTYVDGVCHLPEWDLMQSVVFVGASDVDVVADGALHNCGGLIVESSSNVSVSKIDCGEAFFGPQVYSSNNITLEKLNFQSSEGGLGRALDIQGSQGVMASQLNFEGAFDTVNIASSSDVSVDKSSFDLADGVLFSNVFQSNDVSLDKLTATGGQRVMLISESTSVSLSQSTIILAGTGTDFDSVTVFDSSDLTFDRVTMDRRALTSGNCFRVNGTTDVTLSNNKCLSDPANTSGEALNLTAVNNYLIDRNLFDGSAGGIFVSDNASGTDSNGEISRNTINMTGPYGLFLSGVSGLDVVRNNVTNTAGTGIAGTWYYDENTEGTPLIINFDRNQYSGFAINGECNNLTMNCN